MQKNIKWGFTLVELIIVITILAILATIGFMSFQSYTIDARDWKRKQDLWVLRNGLEIYGTKNQTLLDPDNYATILWASLQWYAWINVLKTLRTSDETKDPKDKDYYTYSKDITGKKYQLLAMLENKDSLAYNQNLFNQANATDYTNRYAYTLWWNFWIYLSWTTQNPVQEWNSWTTISNTWSLILITSNTWASSGWSGRWTFTCWTSTVSAWWYTYNTLSLAWKCRTIWSMKHWTLLWSWWVLPSNINAIEKWCPMSSWTSSWTTIIASNCDTYSGALYTWYEAMWLNDTDTTITIEDITKSVCGQLGTWWHLPNDTDYTALTIAWATWWVSPWNKLSWLISSLPGYRYIGGSLMGLASHIYLWSSSRYSTSDAYFRNLNSGASTVGANTYTKLYGFSVLCLKN